MLPGAFGVAAAAAGAGASGDVFPLPSFHFALPRSWDEVGAEHVGIVAGVCVFWLTLVAVLLILVCDGSFGRMKEQGEAYKTKGVLAFRSKEKRPELYDELLDAAAALPLKPKWPAPAPAHPKLNPNPKPYGVLEGDMVRLEPCGAGDAAVIFAACGGGPYLAHGEYDAYEEIFLHLKEGPFASAEELAAAPFLADVPAERLLKIIAQRDGRVVGTLRLARHRPRDLNVGVEDLWVTPGCRRRGYATEALALVFRHAFSLLYRRVDFFVDAENVQMRRFLERRFLVDSDGLLRKYGVRRRGNQDIAVYGMVNNLWRDLVAGKVAKLLLDRVRADPVLKRKFEARLQLEREVAEEDKWHDLGAQAERRQQKKDK